MLIPSHLQLEPSNSRTRMPAGGIDLIASIDFKSDGATTATLSSSTKVSQGDDAISSAQVATTNHSNQQYSIYAITDAAANIAERYAYTAYGQPTILNAAATVIATSAISNRYTYTAREWDATVGLHHFRARWMSGLTGRFLSRDPIRYWGGLNLFVYVVSNPFANIDPTGLASASASCYMAGYSLTGIGVGSDANKVIRLRCTYRCTCPGDPYPTEHKLDIQPFSPSFGAAEHQCYSNLKNVDHICPCDEEEPRRVPKTIPEIVPVIVLPLIIVNPVVPVGPPITTPPVTVPPVRPFWWYTIPLNPIYFSPDVFIDIMGGGNGVA